MNSTHEKFQSKEVIYSRTANGLDIETSDKPIFPENNNLFCRPLVIIEPQVIKVKQNNSKSNNINDDFSNEDAAKMIHDSIYTIIDDRLTRNSSSNSQNKDPRSIPDNLDDFSENKRNSNHFVINEGLDCKVFTENFVITKISSERVDYKAQNEEEAKRHVELEIIPEVPFSDENAQHNQSNQAQRRDHNENNQETRVEPNNVAEVQPSVPDPLVIGRPEAKLFLARVIGFNLFIFLFLLAFLLFEGSGDNYIWSFFLVDLYNFYQGFIYYFWAKKVLGDLWVESDYCLTLNNLSAAWFSFILLYINYLDLIPFAFISTIPFFVLICCSLMFSNEKFLKKLWVNGIRTFYLIQILLINTRIDGLIDWDWEFVLVPAWICLFLWNYRWFTYFFSLMKLLVNQERDPEARTKKFGFLWCNLYYGLSFIEAFIIFGIGQAYNLGLDNDKRLVTIAACVAIALSIIVCCYTIIARNYLLKFVLLDKLIDSYLVRSQQAYDQIPKKVITFEVEKKDECFVMISSTYFTSLDKASCVNDTESIKAIRESLQMMKLKKLNQSSPVQEHKLKTSSVKIDKELFKKRENKSINTRKSTLVSHGNLIMEGELIKKNFAYSLNDLDEVEKLKINSPRAVEESPLCYVCCVKEPDSILMNCGHGGVCYDCVIPIIKNKDECMQCRNKVEAIYRIKPDPIFTKIYRGIEFHKLVVKQE